MYEQKNIWSLFIFTDKHTFCEFFFSYHAKLGNISVYKILSNIWIVKKCLYFFARYSWWIRDETDTSTVQILMKLYVFLQR